MVGAAIFLVVGLTQFSFAQKAGSASTVILALDVSESMSRTDVEPSRLQAAKDAARVFLDELPDTISVGLVVFSGQAVVLVPPTTEHTKVVDALVGLPRGEGTVIGDALDTSLDAVVEKWRVDGEAPTAIVLLSDGRDTGSSTLPEVAAERAGNLGVQIYTVVLGQDLDPSSAAGANLELMARIATDTGGESYTATSASGLIDVYRTLQTELSTELEITDFGTLFVGAAGVLAIAATAALLLAIRREG